MQAPSHEPPPPTARRARRFAIGDFSDWEQGIAFVDGLLRSGVDGSGIGLLGSTEGLRPLKETLDGRLGPLRELTEPQVTCIGEEVFGLLSDEPGPRPREALEHWLLPSHARRLWAAVAEGRLLVWVAIGSAEQECGVCLGLLQSSGRTVQIHDFGAA